MVHDRPVDQSLQDLVLHETSVDRLKQFAKHSALEIRRSVARNPHTTIDVLLELGKEFPNEITANPIFPLMLLEDPKSEVGLRSLARSSTTPIEVLEGVLKDNQGGKKALRLYAVDT